MTVRVYVTIATEEESVVWMAVRVYSNHSNSIKELWYIETIYTHQQ